MSNTPHMLPCPFCGGDARHDAHADDCYFILHRKFNNSGADMSLAFEVLDAWNRRAPQPVVREPLTDEQLAEIMRDTWGCASIAPRHAVGFARAIEAEVRKQDDALIRQMLEVLEYVRNTPDAEYDSKAALSKAQAAITAGRARLGEKT